ncbi:MAG: DUF1211 domain-containing protein [Bacteroidales bacterium]|nr:DUF1211 domain-containing protein [Clostridia bacterium]MBR1699557.1 DUF1211 domain-containing protein [Bacteroidales bacterium]
MSKERLTAFTDAILAIIMTILVLELELPEAPTFQAVWAMRTGYITYAVSFFWLGAMWVNIHNRWHSVEVIDNKVVWWSIIMLFFASFIPYVTAFVGAHFESRFAQVLYSVVVVLVSLSNMALGAAVDKLNPVEGGFSFTFNKYVITDLFIKGLGILMAILVYPPCAIIGIMLAGFVVTFWPVLEAKNQK